MFEIRTLAEGEVITEPGFYAIPLEQHHNQPCDGPSVTSGVLRKMELETPADVWAFSKLNPNRWEDQPPTAALRMGVAMALYVEGGKDAVLEKFNVHPDDKPRRPNEAQIKAYDDGNPTDAGKISVEYWRAVDASPSGYLNKAEFDLICDMGKVLEGDPAASAVMDGVPEVTMAVRDERTGLWLLSRPDTVSFDGSMSDYKKMNTGGKPFNHRLVDFRITDHGYDMQMAFAASTFEALTGVWPQSVGIVAQVDKPPHSIILREIIEEDLKIADFRNRRAITRFAECLQSEYWPGPGDDVGSYRRPEWQREQLIEEMQTAGEAP